MASKKTYYWDSSVFIAFFKPEPGRVDVVAEFLREAEAGEVTSVTSFMTITEVIRFGDKKGSTEEDQKKIRRFFQKDYIEWVNFDRETAELARDLMWKHDGLKSKDAVHIASALEVIAQGAKLDAIHAYDGDFSALSGKVIGINCPIEPPTRPQLHLPLDDPRRGKGHLHGKKRKQP